MIFWNKKLKDENHRLYDELAELQLAIDKYIKNNDTLKCIIEDERNKNRKLKKNKILNEKKIAALSKKYSHLKKHVNQLKETDNDKILKLKKKIDILKRFRDLNSKFPPTTSFKGSAIDFNFKDSMDKYYMEDANVEKYFSTLQSDIYDLFLDVLAKQSSCLNTSNILDAGCGLGLFTKRLVEYFECGRITGCDFSTTAILKAKNSFPELDFFQHDIYEPLEGNYTLIVCTETIEHLLKPNIVVNNLLKSLNQKNSVLFLSVPDGRFDVSEKHINFWSWESWNIFIKQWANEFKTLTGMLQHPEQTNLRYNWAILKQDLEI